MDDSLLMILLKTKRYVVDILYRMPTSILALLLIFLLTVNALSIFSVHVTLPTAAPRHSSGAAASVIMYSLKEENSRVISKTHSPILKNVSWQKQEKEKKVKRRKILLGLSSQEHERGKGLFAAKVKAFFGNSSNRCHVRFFMTWIGSLNSFGQRESFAIESLFKTHPNGCLLIVSNTMHSTRGTQILKPFQDRGNRVISLQPDYTFLFKNNPAQYWHTNLLAGNVVPGDIPFGQNLSNLLRLALLYKFGGVYIDTDVIILKSFGKLRNVIGAQTVDSVTGNWTRLNNAVLVFDKKHPLVFKFIQEFALTFDGNKWGHNGPYLVSRVVARVRGRPGFDFTVLPPCAFYPVDWSRVLGLFRGPGGVDSKWVGSKYRQISRESYALHLWNRQSRNIRVEEGSIIDMIMSPTKLI